MEFITSDGEKVFYEVSGSGVPAVYIHGGPGYWSKSFQYSMHNLLENQLRMIYVDQRGCGRSEECSNTDFSLNRITDDFEELRDHLGLQDWYLIAHSFGGILALNYAKKYPNRVKGIILSNATLNMVNSFEYQIRYSRKLLGLKKQQLHTGNKESLLNTYYTTISKLAEHNLHNQLQFKDPCNKQILDEIDKDLFFGKSFQQYVFNTGEYFTTLLPTQDQLSNQY